MSSGTSKTMNFRGDQDLKDIFRRWWGSLQQNRGDRAELSHTVLEDRIFEAPAFYRLKRRLEDQDYNVYDRALARTVAVLSRIRLDRDGESLGILLQKRGVAYEQIKPILKIHHPDRLIRKLAVLVDRLSGEAPVVGTADVVYWWEVRTPNREFLYDFFMNESIV